jgi:hypothetical protein
LVGNFYKNPLLRVGPAKPTAQNANRSKRQPLKSGAFFYKTRPDLRNCAQIAPFGQESGKDGAR